MTRFVIIAAMLAGVSVVAAQPAASQRDEVLDALRKGKGKDVAQALDAVTSQPSARADEALKAAIYDEVMRETERELRVKRNAMALNRDPYLHQVLLPAAFKVADARFAVPFAWVDNLQARLLLLQFYKTGLREPVLSAIERVVAVPRPPGTTMDYLGQLVFTLNRGLELSGIPEPPLHARFVKLARQILANPTDPEAVREAILLADAIDDDEALRILKRLSESGGLAKLATSDDQRSRLLAAASKALVGRTFL